MHHRFFSAVSFRYLSIPKQIPVRSYPAKGELTTSRGSKEATGKKVDCPGFLVSSSAKYQKALAPKWPHFRELTTTTALQPEGPLSPNSAKFTFCKPCVNSALQKSKKVVMFSMTDAIKPDQNLLGRSSVAIRTEPELTSLLLISISHGTPLDSVQSEFMIFTVRSTRTFPPSGPTRLLWTTAL